MNRILIHLQQIHILVRFRSVDPDTNEDYECDGTACGIDTIDFYSPETYPEIRLVPKIDLTDPNLCRSCQRVHEDELAALKAFGVKTENPSKWHYGDGSKSSRAP